MSLPSSMDYTKILPIAAGNPRQMRRTFLPMNGQSFSAVGNNIIRIEISASQFWDPSNSYLKFTLTGGNAAANTFGLDNGGLHGIIRRLRLEQAGSILYDCNRYDKMMSAIVLPSQSNLAVVGDRSITEGQRYGTTGAAGATNEPIAAGGTTGAILGNQHNVVTQIAGNGTITLCAPLVGSLFSQSKLVPLQLLSSSPLTIEIELAPPADICISANVNLVDYSISDVSYVASLVDVSPDVDNQVRMIQEMSGGHIVLNCTDFTHFNGNIAAGQTGQQAINVPARRKSIKNICFVGGSQTYGGNQNDLYNTSFGGNFNLNNYQMKIGSILHPAVPVACNFAGAGADLNVRGEAFLELTKCFAPVNNLVGTGQLSRMNYAVTDCDVGGMATSGTVARYSPFGLDMEAFQRTAIESGVNTADRSTPITLLLNIGAANAEAINVDAFVAYDALYYIDSSGVISVAH